MTTIPCKNLDDGVKQFHLLKQCKPYQYSGRWHLAYLDGKVYCYQREGALKNRLCRAGVARLEYVTTG